MRRISCFAQPTGTICCCRCSLSIFSSSFRFEPIFFFGGSEYVRTICESYAYKYKEDAPFIFVIFETNVWYEMHICCSFLFSYSFFVCSETFGIYTSFGFYSAPNANCMRRNKRNEKRERKNEKNRKKIIAFVWYVRQSFVLVFFSLLFRWRPAVESFPIFSSDECVSQKNIMQRYNAIRVRLLQNFCCFCFWSFFFSILFGDEPLPHVKMCASCHFYWNQTNFRKQFSIFSIISFDANKRRKNFLFVFVWLYWLLSMLGPNRTTCIPVSYFVATGNSSFHSTAVANLNVFLFSSASAQFLFRLLSSFADFSVLNLDASYTYQ